MAREFGMVGSFYIQVYDGNEFHHFVIKDVDEVKIQDIFADDKGNGTLQACIGLTEKQLQEKWYNYYDPSRDEWFPMHTLQEWMWKRG